MATHVDSESRHDRTTTGRAAAEDAGTHESAASFAQQRLWLIDRLQPGSAVYNIALVADVFGPLNIAALEASFGEVVQRHDGLRTSFRVSGGRPLQVVHRRLRAPVSVIDLRGVASPGQGAIADGVLRALTARPFDLERPPLFALSVLSLDARTHVLALCVHHAIFDQWSEEIVVGELARLYDACVRGGPARLTPPSLQYPAFAERQRPDAGRPGARSPDRLLARSARLARALRRGGAALPPRRRSRDALERQDVVGEADGRSGDSASAADAHVGPESLRRDAWRLHGDGASVRARGTCWSPCRCRAASRLRRRASSVS